MKLPILILAMMLLSGCASDYKDLCEKVGKNSDGYITMLSSFDIYCGGLNKKWPNLTKS